jgi:ferritin
MIKNQTFKKRRKKMITNTMQKAINEQINKELYSSYLYLAMAAYFEDKNLPGFAKWMKVQADEEREHGMKFFEHLVDRGGKVELAPIAGPETEWNTNLEVFQQVKEHEAFVTASINALYELALKEKDYPAQVLLQWFISEQVEEEKNAAEIVQTLELIDAKGTAVLMLDHELGHRGKE